ncbi:MAG: hypothetical protein ACXIT4_12685 [Erythrobacter sp.]
MKPDSNLSKTNQLKLPAGLKRWQLCTAISVMDNFLSADQKQTRLLIGLDSRFWGKTANRHSVLECPILPKPALGEAAMALVKPASGR